MKLTLEQILDVSAKSYEDLKDENRISILQIIRKNGDGYELTGHIYGLTEYENRDQLLWMVRKTWTIEFGSDPTVIGLVLSIDGWTYPDEIAHELSPLTDEERDRRLDEIGPPSQHPQRRSIATVTVVTPTRTLVRSQIRGEEPVTAEDGVKFGGAILEALQQIVK